jgi:serine/threonine protein kinase
MLQNDKFSPDSIRKKKKKIAVRGQTPATQQLGIYRLGQVIGKGAAGTVYKAINTQTGEFVAIKQIPASNSKEIDNIADEISLLQSLKHPNIVKYIATIKTPAHLNIITEYVENGSLSSLLKKFGRFPESLVQVYTQQVCCCVHLCLLGNASFCQNSLVLRRVSLIHVHFHSDA